MSNVIRVALPGINALESADPRDYSLFTDEDNLLIKEHSRGSGTTSGTLTVTHDLGYFPHFYTYGEISSGRFQLVNGYNLFGDWRSITYTDDLEIQNTGGPANAEVRYFIFYDDIPN